MMHAPNVPEQIAPDGSRIRALGTTTRGSCAHCTLRGGEVSKAITHRTVEELWYVLDGSGPDEATRVPDHWPIPVETDAL